MFTVMYVEKEEGSDRKSSGQMEEDIQTVIGRART